MHHDSHFKTTRASEQSILTIDLAAVSCVAAAGLLAALLSATPQFPDEADPSASQSEARTSIPSAMPEAAKREPGVPATSG